MKKLIVGLGLALVVFIAGSARAVPISETHTITGSGSGSVGYTYFDVTTGGIFDIFTMGPTIDPQLYLFTDDGSLDIGDLLATDDDGCLFAQCGPAGAFSNSLIDEILLSLGSYIAAVSDFNFLAAEAVAGLNNNNMKGDVSINIDAGSTDTFGADAVITSGGLETIPEPASVALFGVGLLGLGVLRRRKKVV